MEEASEAQVCGRGVEERVWKKEVVMVSRPQGMPVEANFEVRRSELVFQVPPPPGFLLVKVLWLSVDPYLREIMNEDNGLTVIPPFQIGQPVFAGSISKGLASSDPKFKEGNIVQTISPVADYALISSEFFSIDKIEHTHATNVPLNQYLGVLGCPGLTAWVGLNVITQLQANEEVIISAAAGAVGLLAGQLAKLKGCRVVGSAGTDEKVRVLKEVYHFDEAFNYKTEKDLNLTLKSTTSWQEYKERDGVRNLMHVIGKSLKMEGFMVGDYWHMRDDFIKEVGELLQQGKVSYHMDILGRGIDEFTKAFVGLLGGKNTGKAVLFIDNGENHETLV